jgi:hypothetical protein
MNPSNTFKCFLREHFGKGHKLKNKGETTLDDLRVGNVPENKKAWAWRKQFGRGNRGPWPPGVATSYIQLLSPSERVSIPRMVSESMIPDRPKLLNGFPFIDEDLRLRIVPIASPNVTL